MREADAERAKPDRLPREGDGLQYEPVASSASITASVVIPVKNARWIIGEVLTSLVEQETGWPFEVIVIDSGSRDGTLEIVRSFASVRVVEIEPSDYGHGRTRNLGVCLARGEFVAFLTHDAVPNDRQWLQRLVQPMLDNREVAGVFGRHVAHAGATACTSRDLELHFGGFHKLGATYRLEDADRYASDPGYRQLLHFYSDNNSCMRRSVWERIPYPDVDFAEDQLWAQAIIEKGYVKAYAHDAVVRHSHDYGIVETFRRSFDEAAAFSRFFGYRMAGSLRGSVATASACARRDFAYTRAQRPGMWREALRSAFGNFAKQAGYLLGTHSGALPGWLIRSVSIDNRLKYGAFNMAQGLRRFLQVWRGAGLRTALSKVLGKASRKVAPVAEPTVAWKTDVPGFYRALYDPATDLAAPLTLVVDDGQEPVDVVWLIPDFGEGSGGHLNIVRFLRGLEALGTTCAIIIVGPHAHPNNAVASARLNKYFGAVNARVYFESDALPRARSAVATSWLTAHYLRHYPGAQEECYYFIQDYEPDFYPSGFDANAAARTYEFGFKLICAGTWLVDVMRERHGQLALGHFGFSYDKTLYRPTGKRDSTRRVFFYARPPTPRRGFELGLMALDLVGRMRPDVEFIFAGWDISSYKFEHVHLNGGILSTEELPDLYSQCDVALILSFSNMSLLPYEVMACGCAVVTNDDACATWGLTSDVATMASTTPEQIATAIVALLDDEPRRREQIERALKFVAQTSWDTEIEAVSRMISRRH